MYARLRNGLHTFDRMKLQHFKLSQLKAIADMHARWLVMTEEMQGVTT